MSRRIFAPSLLLCGLPLIASAADQAELTLLSKPVAVTAALTRSDESGDYIARISVHSGPIAHVVNTFVAGESRGAAAAEQRLRQFVQARTPYILVSELCGGSDWNCESVAVFKMTDNVVVRMGDFIGNFDSVVRDGHLYDLYDKLQQKVDGLSHAASPRFTIAFNDTGNALTVNAGQTWESNQPTWRSNADLLATLKPDNNWLPADWERYLSALVTNAALARYCQRQNELQSLLAETEPKLDVLHRRALTDALSKVIPLELPKAWRRTH